jgi:hypothetical protein
MGKKKLFDSSAVLSICAMLVSVMTLVVLIYQTSIMREQQRMSVLPYLTISNFGTDTPNFKVVLENSGVGPAFIKSSVIKWKGKNYKIDLVKFFFQNAPSADSIRNLYHTNLSEGALIPAQRQIPLLEVRDSFADSHQLYSLYNGMMDSGLEYEIIYSNVYDEEWKISSTSKMPVKR